MKLSFWVSLCNRYLEDRWSILYQISGMSLYMMSFIRPDRNLNQAVNYIQKTIEV